MSDDELLRAEMKRLYNVTYNGKNAALIFKDIENINEAILYAQDNRNKGAKTYKIRTQH